MKLGGEHVGGIIAKAEGRNKMPYDYISSYAYMKLSQNKKKSL